MNRLLFVVLVGIVVVMALPLSNLILPQPERIPSQMLARKSDPYFTKAAPILEKKCLDCHSVHTNHPWYFRVPGAKQIISRDIARGTSHLDLMKSVFDAGAVPSDRDLAKIEAVLYTNSMPPLRYQAMHWDAGLTAEDKQVLLDWIYHTRAKRANPELVSAEFAGEPIQPIAPPDLQALNPDKVALGKALFHDVRLSADNTISCASCHALHKGGTDQAKSSTGIKQAVGPINAPTVYNAHLNFVQFWDGRSLNLQDQANGPVNNPMEMGANWPDVIAKLKADPQFLTMYHQVYSGDVSSKRLTEAIAAFETSLATPNSRFDQYLKGNKAALSEDEKRGYELFKKTGCIACHHGPGVGGTGFEKMGEKVAYFKKQENGAPADLGRFNVTKNDVDRHVFKVPLLRNIEKTYPYFHNGSTQDLEEAVRIMAKHQLGRSLTEQEAHQIALFLKTLTGEHQGKPLQ